MLSIRRLQCFLRTLLVGFEPVGAPPCVCDEGYGEGAGRLHLFDDKLLYPTLLFGHDGEVEFVVYLEYHLRAQAFGFHATVDAYHGYFDDVGGGALYGGVDGVALGKVADDGVVGVDVGQVAATVEQGLGIAVLARGLLGLFHIVVHLREGLEIAVDELARLVA